MTSSCLCPSRLVLPRLGMPRVLQQNLQKRARHGGLAAARFRDERVRLEFDIMKALNPSAPVSLEMPLQSDVVLVCRPGDGTDGWVLHGNKDSYFSRVAIEQTLGITAWQRRWSSGRIRPCHGRDPGSIPGRRTDLFCLSKYVSNGRRAGNASANMFS